MQYRRNYVAGGTYFFTVNLLERRETLLVDHIDDLRQAIRCVKRQKPFDINALVILPDHHHAVWTLPPNDADYSSRWVKLKSAFLKHCPKLRGCRRHESASMSVVFGSDASGNIQFGTSKTIAIMSIMFT